MHLVNDQLVVRGQLEVIALPVEAGGVVNDAIPGGVGDLPCVRVDPLHLSVAVDDHEFIFLPRLCRLDVPVPGTVLFVGEGCGVV